MTNHNLTHVDKSAANHQKLTPNEKAIIDSVKIPVLRDLFTSIWQVKLRLQFTGWLQYVPPLLFTFAIFLIAWLIQFLGSSSIANLFVCIGIFLLAVQFFDLVTVKFRIRFPEALPHHKDDMDLFDLMRSRRSCRSFQTRKLTDADFNELMGYVKCHSEAPKVGKAPIRFEYVSAPLIVWPTVNATQFLVAIAPKKYDRLAIIDVGRSMQKIVMDATRMGLGTCWIGPGADHASIIKELGDRFNEQEDHIICVCAVGYRSGYIPLFIRVFNAQFYRRRPLSALFFSDPQFTRPLNVEAEPFNRFGRTFEICQWAPSSYNGQTTRCVAVTDGSDNGKSRVEHFDFYEAIESRYYAPVALGIWIANWELGCDALGIHGHLALLSPEARGIKNEKSLPELPRYNLSWMLDEDFLNAE